MIDSCINCGRTLRVWPASLYCSACRELTAGDNIYDFYFESDEKYVPEY
ncbi:hypothetical protein EV146_11361 [Mesobacillus foraminis]|uniref:Uncharacterized protein n=1 Tax=Mesobacillus foraminis TaxID=279826 RepID=A0A4R2B3D7_9BACI|nr:hypothetical protein EV146_11361 [Mesobacillus foraminis]